MSWAWVIKVLLFGSEQGGAEVLREIKGLGEVSEVGCRKEGNFMCWKKHYYVEY